MKVLLVGSYYRPGPGGAETVGDGPLRTELEAQARRLGIGGRVRFCGFRNDARALIGRLDVLVVSSHTDGSPLVVLEAMGAGVPVVATAVGGIPDQVRHGREGLLVPPADPAAMAAATLGLLGDPARARALGRAGRRRANELGHEPMVACMEQIYRTVVAATSPATGHPVPMAAYAGGRAGD